MIAVDQSAEKSRVESEGTNGTDFSISRHVLRVDFSERAARLLALAQNCADFEVRMDRLDVGDYCIDAGVVIERKTYADLAMSLTDGRLFPQAAALARSPHRPIVLIEGPKPAKMPNLHTNSLRGAVVSLAVMWRLPVLHARDPEDSLQILRFLAHQMRNADPAILQRYDRKPKRLASRKLFVLQGLPGVGPALANRLLVHFGSVERVIAADEAKLIEVRGIGVRKAQRIRKLVS
jgi:DNA excision repair protein ERCC-4